MKNFDTDFKTALQKFSEDRNLWDMIWSACVDLIKNKKFNCDFINQLQMVIDKKNYTDFLPLCDMLYSLYYYNKLDIKKAWIHNEAARDKFQNFDTKNNKKLYLRFLNNSSVYDNAMNKKIQSYVDARLGLNLSSEIDDSVLDHMVRNNIANTLCNLNMPQAAKIYLLKNVDKPCEEKPLSTLSTYETMANIAFQEKDWKSVLNFRLKEIEINNKERFFPKYIFNAHLLRVYIKLNDSKNINKFFNLLWNAPNHSIIKDEEIWLLYITYGLYFASISDTENATKYYFEAYDKLDIEAENQIPTLLEIYDFFNDTKQIEHAYIIQKKIMILLYAYNQNIEDFLIDFEQKNSTFWSNNNLSINSHRNYNDEHFLKISKTINACDSIPTLQEELNSQLKAIIEFSDLYLFFHEPGCCKCELSYFKKNKKLCVENDSIINKYYSDRTPLVINNLVDNNYIPNMICTETKSLFLLPLNFKENTIGMLLFTSLKSATFDVYTRNQLEYFSDHIAVALTMLMNNMLIQERSILDPLTNLLNRRGLIKKLESDPFDPPYAFIAFDIDNFKKINDKHGHSSGDDVLKLLSEIVNSINYDCFTCRLGGDEFVMISKISDKSDLELLCKQLKFEFNYKSLQTLGFDIYISQGALLVTDSYAYQTLYTKADELLYKVKENGKNNYLIEEI